MRDNVAHHWAAKNLDGTDVPDLVKYTGNGKRSNFWWDGPTIYSYGRHFCIARVVENKAGKKAVLFTRRGYSVTTNKHKSFVRSALHGRATPVFDVADPGAVLDGQQEQDHYNKAVLEAFESAARASSRGEWYLGTGHRLVQEGNALAQFMGWTWRLEAPKDLEALKAKVKKAAQAKAKATKEEAAKLSAAKVRWAAFWPDFAAQWRSHPDVLELPDDLVKYRQQGKLQDLETLLRVSQDGESVETSRRASVPVEDVRAVWPKLQILRKRGKDWAREVRGDGEGLRVGHFILERVSAAGDLTIGCHELSAAEVDRLAVTLGLS